MADSKKTETEIPVGKMKVPIKVEDVKFTKQALISSPKFSVIERDILKLALDDDKEYTIAEVQKAVEKFKEGY
ncbi:hypothetical protein CBF58_09570 [Lactobacillus taiwanensis]|uniref:Uncharacterized protein n=2 Tax=Lactobacillus taiwanensis TaxID=508451 RepID=A0A256LFI6_9LACO|nr:hypothetical protein CBF53_03975 [Lactobacillus taiwanensis]OYR92045.1 hypothetical protein CBF59_04165 [Lactobacillus taiwanensis]OYR92201.1 hypothetical protein CBF70_04065 [Lactobacillus taiwanensis]OYR94355.1 hypothetical protein CBF58_09570 [Lactobacillus taiwanensis]